jgi:hypothetical protein
LIYHDTVPTRAFGAGLRPATPASPGSGGFAAAKRAERSVSAPLNFSRYCYKFSSADFSLLADLQHFRI